MGRRKLSGRHSFSMINGNLYVPMVEVVNHGSLLAVGSPTSISILIENATTRFVVNEPRDNGGKVEFVIVMINSLRISNLIR
jgi:hypothetical protein